MRSSPWVALALGLVLPAIAAAEGLYLHRIATSGGDRARLSAGQPVRLRAFVGAPEALGETLSTVVRAVHADSVEIELAGYPVLGSSPDRTYREATFLVDFEEEDVQALRKLLVAQHGDAPPSEALRRFTDEAIPSKSLARGWDPASRIASAGIGDCTEHAVLLAALARSFGRPARVTLGLLLVRIEGEVVALGHAWTELRDGDGWLAVDATPVAEEVDELAYLPLLVLDEEGPGYALALGRHLQRGWVSRIEFEPPL
ncbi:MAG: transglutaminase-like domain-containing protein [Myxococcota bacterium]